MFKDNVHIDRIEVEQVTDWSRDRRLRLKQGFALGLDISPYTTFTLVELSLGFWVLGFKVPTPERFWYTFSYHEKE